MAPLFWLPFVVSKWFYGIKEMRAFITMFFILFVVTSHARGTSLHAYDEVIAEIVANAESRQRNIFLRCAEQWDRFPEKTAEFEALLSVAKVKNGEPILKLEIGDAGYGSYDFILIDYEITRSSFRKEKISTPRDILNQYARLRIHEPLDFVDLGRPATRDGQCYFLTVKKGATERGVAVYGSPGNSKIGKLIKKTLDMVR